jgi:hypothetical protein
MTDVMPEQTVDLDAIVGEESTVPAPAGELDAIDEQLIARLAGRARKAACSSLVRAVCWRS